MQVLLQLPFDLSVSVLKASNVPLETCLVELPVILHTATLCVYFPSVTKSCSIKVVDGDPTRLRAWRKKKDAAFAKQPHPLVFEKLLRAMGMFSSLQELVLDMQRTSFRYELNSLLFTYVITLDHVSHDLKLQSIVCKLCTEYMNLL